MTNRPYLFWDTGVQPTNFFFFAFSRGSLQGLRAICGPADHLCLTLGKEIQRGNRLWWAILLSSMSYCNTGFFVAKPPSNFIKRVAFLGWTSILHAFRLTHGKQAATIICAYCAKWLRQIRRYNNSPPYVTVKMGTAP